MPTRSPAICNVGLADLESSLRPMINSLCWESHWNATKGLSLRFGEPFVEEIGVQDLPDGFPNRRRRISIRGTWNLWVYLAFWSIDANGTTLASSSSGVSDTISAVDALKGQRLIDASTCKNSGKTRFVFEFDTSLTVRRRLAKSKDELWVIYGRDGKQRTICGDGSFHSIQMSKEHEMRP